MAIKSSGTLALSEIQTEMGGSNPIALTEYYGADVGMPTSGTIKVSDFYGHAKRLTASYTQIFAASIPNNAGGVGENFYRTAYSWTNSTGREGQIRSWGGWSHGFEKIRQHIIYIDGTAVSSWSSGYAPTGASTVYWDTSGYISKTGSVVLSVYLWGAYNSDHITGGSFYIGGS